MATTADKSTRSRVDAFLHHPWLKVAASLLLVAIAVGVLRRIAADVSWAEVRAALASYRWPTLLAAVGFTGLSFASLAIYDVLAVASVVPGRVPVHIAAVTGASGYAISNLLGFSWLTGGAMRYRIYSALGLDWSRVAGVIATSWVSFWIGIVLVIALILALHPSGAAPLLSQPPGFVRIVGIAVLASIAVGFRWLGQARQSIRFGSVRLDLPTQRLAMAQTSVAVLDLLAASMTLYVLLPGDVAPSFLAFYLVFVMAIGLGVLSHTPGGIGVFEATFIAGLGAGGRPDVLAALLLYRLIYFLLPFLVAMLGLAAVFIAARRRHAGQVARALQPLILPVVPPLAAGVALASGALLLVSGNLPAEAHRLRILRDVLPLPFVELSHLAGSIVGVLLIVIARGLYLKQRRAWIAASVLVALGLVASIAKGLAWEEASSLGVAFGLLMLFRPAFYRAADPAFFQLTWRWVIGSAALIAVSIWIGFFTYSDIPYSNDLWWQFAWHGNAPRFLRASLAVSILFCAISFNSLITYRGTRLPPEPIPERVRALVAASPVADASVALTGDKRFLVSEDGRAFLSYADSGGSLIAKGDPIGEPGAGETLIWRLRELSDRLGKRCAFYAISAAYLPAFLDMGLSILKIGELARVDLPAFSLDGPARKDFRYAHRRAEREGLAFEIVRAADLAPQLPGLRRVSDAWLVSKSGEEKGFAIGAFDPGYLRNFDHGVLRAAESGEIVAFASLFQGAERAEIAVDLMRYDPTGPSYAMDALFANLMLWAKAEGFRWFSLGAAPFSGLQDHPLASVWNRLGSYLYRHGEQFYHFEGLRSFKEKFGPAWSPIYLASPRGLSTPRVLYEVNVLISGGVAGLIR